jgi:hypothetical protein
MHKSDRPNYFALLARLAWMLVGPPLLAIFAYLVIRTGKGWLTLFDYGYFTVASGLVFARWLEFRLGNPQTAEGQPATPQHLRHYIVEVVTIGVLLWVIANILGNYVVNV